MVDIVGLATGGPVASVEAWLREGQELTLAFSGVRFTQFREEDSEALHAIRNHDSVRPFMPSPEPLPLIKHQAWVEAQLRAPGPLSPLILVGRDEGVPVGFGLLKPAGPGALEVGAMVVGAWQNTALPARLVAGLVATADAVFGARFLLTHVSRAHGQALRFNRGWGLQEVPSVKPGELCLRAPMAAVLATPLYRRCARGLHIEASSRIRE